jgi:hypothetical protein
VGKVVDFDFYSFFGSYAGKNRNKTKKNESRNEKKYAVDSPSTLEYQSTGGS